jgi:4-hydroxy-tetrahydrodipicolinate synthase
LPVIAAGTFADSLEQIAGYSARLADTGVAAVVCITNQFCREPEDDSAWKRGAERLLGLLDPVLPLGLYECPLPYRRLMSPELLEWASATNRFLFLKDTSCSMAKINPKIDAMRHSSMRFFNANAVTLLDSLRAGGHGFSGIAANFFPQLYAWMCREYARQPETAERLQWFMSATDLLVHHKYPASAKYFLGTSNLRLGTKCRTVTPTFSEEDAAMLNALRLQGEAWHRELGLGPFLLAA